MLLQIKAYENFLVLCYAVSRIYPYSQKSYFCGSMVLNMLVSQHIQLCRRLGAPLLGRLLQISYALIRQLLRRVNFISLYPLDACYVFKHIFRLCHVWSSVV